MPDVTDQPVNDVAAARQAFFDQYAVPQPQLPPQAFEPQVSQRQLIDTWNHARNVEQAQKAVDAQMRMLGILRVKAAIEKGVDPAAATYSNLHLLAPPYGKNFSANMKAVAPPPVPRATNFNFQGGVNVPAVVTGGKVQFVPGSSLPKTQKPNLFHVGNSLVRVNPDGSQEVLFSSNDPSKLDQWEHSELMSQLNASKQFGMDSKEYKDAQQALKDFRTRFTSPKGSTTKESEAMPMPKTKIELQIGKKYRTLRGDAMWDGEHFVK